MCGYTCGDLFGQDVLLRGAQDALQTVAAATKDAGMLVFAGVPLQVNGVLYNCAAALCGGEVLAFIPKRHLPNYAEFYEKRNFQPYNGENIRVSFGGKEVPFGSKFIFRCREERDFTVAAELCEDLWVPAPPSVAHALAGANIIVNLSASDETAGKAEYRHLLVRAQSAKTVSGYVYADAGDGESTTDMVFSGHDLICENGEMLAESTLFANGIVCSEIDVSRLAYERRRINTFYDASDLARVRNDRLFGGRRLGCAHPQGRPPPLRSGRGRPRPPRPSSSSPCRRRGSKSGWNTPARRRLWSAFRAGLTAPSRCSCACAPSTHCKRIARASSR